jgi:hypothetical protein
VDGTSSMNNDTRKMYFGNFKGILHLEELGKY